MKIVWSHKLDEFRLPAFIPDELLSESHALINHGEGLKAIDDRGGMAIDEVVCNIMGLSLAVRIVMNDNIFAELLKNYLHFKGLNNSDNNKIGEGNGTFEDGLHEVNNGLTSTEAGNSSD